MLGIVSAMIKIFLSGRLSRATSLKGIAGTSGWSESEFDGLGYGDEDTCRTEGCHVKPFCYVWQRECTKGARRPTKNVPGCHESKLSFCERGIRLPGEEEAAAVRVQVRQERGL